MQRQGRRAKGDSDRRLQQAWVCQGLHKGYTLQLSPAWAIGPIYARHPVLKIAACIEACVTTQLVARCCLDS
ncbi:hypothetical protein MGYG_02700 [Nannizzia gypsea CBS 118893]|uniref:Uncharacterized protein n=1 Tax=Arthroderma gypseum (strain ATCC MYA-4604 / CBS 118893) TaxID=535722 RepID=E4UNT4_ARTGP|nr:hypothetical protein MGYG_02700 [Nannizzia gypsea CBS 118893]EFQ99687.1 hypothetical protein MGYG_02700 [Nannizzia gypsea CBS 118893]